MNVELWVVLAIGAGLAQTGRNALAQTISARVSPALNSWSRFTFCLPFASVAVLIVVADRGMPRLSPVFFGLCLLTAATQLLANVSLVSAFRVGHFGEAIVFHKLEVILTAVAGALWFAEPPSLLGAAGILVCAVGVIAINLARDVPGATLARAIPRALHFGRAGSLALACAALLVAASFALKAANAVVMEANDDFDLFSAAVQTLFHTTWMEVLLLSSWIALREPRSFRDVPRHWRRMLLIGTASFTASLGWFWAFSLTVVAYVKAVGQIEALIAVALGLRVLGERGLMRQLPGMALVVFGILLVLLG